MILEFPLIVKIFITLFLILFLNKFLNSLFISVLISAFFLSIWLGHSFEIIYVIFSEAIFSMDTLFLTLLVFSVITLTNQMSEIGIMQKLVEKICNCLSKRLSIAALPALIGFLPMPGGALFTAPLVQNCDTDDSIDTILKVRINFWFRHVWELWWPLYPGVIMAVSISKVELWKFMLAGFPLTVVAIVSGYFFLLKKIKNNNLNGKFRIYELFMSIFKLLFPVFIIITVTLIITFFFPSIKDFNRYYPMLFGVFLAIMFQQFMVKLSFLKWRKIIFSKKTFEICLLMFSISIYGKLISSPLPTGEFVFSQIHNELKMLGISFVLVTVLVSFLSGFTIGLAVGFVGICFPLILTGNEGFSTPMEFLGLVILSYGFGFIGMMMSPVHVCLIVTNNYFKSSILKSILGLFPPLLCVALGTVLLYIFLGAL